MSDGYRDMRAAATFAAPLRRFATDAAQQACALGASARTR